MKGIIELANQQIPVMQAILPPCSSHPCHTLAVCVSPGRSVHAPPTLVHAMAPRMHSCTTHRILVSWVWLPPSGPGAHASPRTNLLLPTCQCSELHLLDGFGSSMARSSSQTSAFPGLTADQNGGGYRARRGGQERVTEPAHAGERHAVPSYRWLDGARKGRDRYWWGSGSGTGGGRGTVRGREGGFLQCRVHLCACAF